MLKKLRGFMIRASMNVRAFAVTEVHGWAPLLIALLVSIAAILVTGDVEYNTAVILKAILCLNLLLNWVWLSGKILDAADKDDGDADAKGIDGGNVAVAIWRTGRFAVLTLAGALLIFKI